MSHTTVTSVSKSFPLLSWEPPFLVSKRGDLTLSYQLQLPPTYALSVADYEQLHAVWVRALRLLPDYCIVHRLDGYFPATWQFPAPEGMLSFLERSSREHFLYRPYLQQSSYLFLTLSSPQAMHGTSLASILCRNRVVPPEMLAEERIARFQEAAEQFQLLLQEAGISIESLMVDALLGTPQQLGLIEQYLNLQAHPQQGNLCDHELTDSTYHIGDQVVCAYALQALDALPSKVYNYLPHPAYSQGSYVLPMDFTHSLGRALPFPHWVQTYYFLENDTAILAELEKRGREQAALSKLSRSNAVHQEKNEAYIQEALTTHRRTVKMGYGVWIWDEDPAQLQQKKSQVSAHLLALDACPVQVKGILPALYWAGVPGAASDYPSEMLSLTFLEPACCFLGQEGMPSLQASTVGIRLCERLSGLPLSVDLSEQPLQKGIINNRNKFILGPSGSGKSFFTNHLLRQYYDQGAHVLIVDVGDSYQGLCTLIHEESGGQDGVYFSYTEEHPIAFNPFFVGEGGYSIEKREQLAALIFCLWKNESETITKAEETQIATALSLFIQGIEAHLYAPSFNAFYEFLQGPFQAQLEAEGVQTQHFDLTNLLQVLRPYASGGMYEFLLNAPEELDLLNQRFIVFEIDTIKDHKTLFPVVTLILMDTFITKMRHASLSHQKKVILIEEAWKAISKTGTAEFIKYLFKTVRKHYGEAIVVTQELEDIVGNAVVKNTILSNADCKILLDQRKYANRFEEVQAILGLTEAEVPLVLSLNQALSFKGRNKYKEVFISWNSQLSQVYGVEVSASEYWVYTTEKKEKAALWEAYEQLGSFQAAVQQMVSHSP